MYEETTIAAIATAPGEGGIGIVRISGRDAAAVADRIFQRKRGGRLSDGEPWRLYYGHVVKDGAFVDEGLAVFMKAPRSYTGEDVAEIQIHGSMEALRQTLALALEAGAVLADRGEFTKRAFLNGRMDLTQAEAVMDIITARGRASLAQAESHLAGALSRYVRSVREKLTDFITRLEVTIDYPEEDLEDLTLADIQKGLAEMEEPMEALLARSERGRIIREGLRTAIVGRPNAGKSSLLNALLQEDRAIVTDVPGTTRDTIEESVRIGGVPLVLMDTAGLRRTESQVEKIGIERARRSMERADLILAVIDGSVPMEGEDRDILSYLKGRKGLVILNKSDLPQAVFADEAQRLSGGAPVIALSAKKGDGIAELEETLRTISEGEDMDAGRALFLTNLRHTELVRQALAAVQRAEEGAASGMPADCITVDLTEAWRCLGEITGDVVDDELITSIFSRFCVGK